ncbi:alpha/beta hydrolase [Lignipirellula cremea]|uniref:Carboxylesterase NlhH n=1 Tax=Lignipirellula cremea TaxID=2528010 RepID=A0A518DLN9_9BACT|nr:alpha/beta hydrolase [Lignipirellula cremea]QDU92749.1 Carboxylesterase NlhH [Lignipirellula cremea]
MFRSLSFLLPALLLGGALLAQAEEPTSANDPVLASRLKQYPQADTNQDGVLTQFEAKTFYRNVLLPKLRIQRQPTHADVSYGPHPRQVFDLYLAKSERPTPLVIYLHGGGFVGGDKRTVNGEVVDLLHAAGISVAAIHYRLVGGDVQFPAPQHDAARAVQTLRHQAEKWNLDPQRFAAYGSSAGAGISMWLGFHDDLAQPDSDDPIARQSTRLLAVGSVGGQSSYDPHVIRDWIGGRAWEHPSVLKVYGASQLSDLDDPKLQPLYDEVSAIQHVSQDDPPILMFYSEPDQPLPADARPGEGIHHPIFGHKLKAAMTRAGVEAQNYHQTNAGGPLSRLLAEFMIKNLNAPR